MTKPPSHYWINAQLERAEPLDVAAGRVAAYSHGYEAGANQDAALVLSPEPESLLLAVADGAGGMPLGGPAAKLAVEHLSDAVARGLSEGESLRESVLRGFDDANGAIQALGSGAAATLAVVVVEGRRMRTYHAGDAAVLVTGQRGRLKLVTIAHSPVGYAVEAGVISEEDAILHEDRHVVSNLLGSPEMRIEIGGELLLSERDTVAVGSDGLFDNLRLEEIIDRVRIGALPKAGTALAQAVHARMQAADGGEPSKPDDVTFLLYRPR